MHPRAPLESSPETGDLNDLADRLAERVAERVAEQVVLSLHERPLPALVDVATYARHIGMSVDYCRTHWRELGGIELPAATGEGKRPRRVLRFDPSRLPQPQPDAEPAGPPRQDSARRPGGRRGDLLPIRGRAA